MNKIYSSLILLFLTFVAKGQHVEWIAANPVQWSFNPGMVTQSVKVSANGNIISSRLDISQLNFNQDVYGTQIIECRDVASNVLWSFSITDSAAVHFIRTDGNNDIYIAGSFLGTAHLNGVDTINNDSPVMFNENEFIIKLSSGGSLIWKFNATVNNFIPKITAMTVDPSDRFWFCSSNFVDSKIYMMGNSGTLVDSILINDSRNVSGIAIDPFGSMYICGAVGSPQMFINGIQYNISESYAMYIARLNANPPHNVDFVHIGHDVTFQFPQVITDGSGGAYFAGSLMDSVIWGNIALPPPQWTNDFFLMRVDSSGNFLWGRSTPHTPTITGSFGFNNGSVILDRNAMSDVFIAGTLNGSVNWGNGVMVNGQIGSENIHVVSFDQNNNPLWQKTAVSDFSFPTCISVSNTNDVYLAASTSDTCTLDTITVNSGGNLASILVKISYSAVAVGEINVSSVQLYPNPAAEYLNIPAKWMNQRIEIFDAYGRLIPNAFAGSDKISVANLSDGVYIIRCKNESSRFLKTN
jgi:hypothetical protein